MGENNTDHGAVLGAGLAPPHNGANIALEVRLENRAAEMTYPNLACVTGLTFDKREGGLNHSTWSRLYFT